MRNKAQAANTHHWGKKMSLKLIKIKGIPLNFIWGCWNEKDRRWRNIYGLLHEGIEPPLVEEGKAHLWPHCFSCCWGDLSCRVCSQGAGMAWSPCALTSGNSVWVCALPGAGYWRGLLNVPRSLTAYWQEESPKNSHEVQQQGTALRCSRGPEACEEECAADCCKHRHRELEMETYGGSTGCETRPTPATERDPAAGRAWGQRELLEKGSGTSICRRNCRIRESPFAGKLWGRASLLVSLPAHRCYFPAGLMPSGNSLRSAARRGFLCAGWRMYEISTSPS